MSKKELNLAKQAIGKILRQLKIEQVVYVDDIFEDKQDVAKVIGWFAEAYSKSPTETSNLMPGVPFDAPDEVWRQELRSAWEELDTERHKEIVIQLSRIRGNQLAADFEAASRMRSLFPRKINFAELSPSLWEERRDSIINKASIQARILCLFDQNLSEADGFTSSGTKSGIGLIQDVVNRDVGGSVICGLVTHTIPSLENEMLEWRRLAEESQLGLNQFLPLAKLRLTEGISPLLFADGIKKTVLNIFCEELKAATVNVLRDAHEDAVNKLMHLDVYDFDYMILQASFSEGEWEANTLIRVFHIFQQDSIRQLMLEPAHSGNFNKNVEIARSISAISTIGNEPGYPWNVRRIRQNELYEEADLIRHSPLQVGDFFELKAGNGTSHTFILLAQPCDLMVRKNGTRDDGDNIIVPLVPIADRISYEEAESKRRGFLRKQAFLYYFYPGSNDVAVLRFADTHWIIIDVLDLAVLDGDGVCRLDLKTENLLPPQFTVGWKDRVKMLIDKYEGQRKKLDAIERNIAVIEDERIRKTLWQSVMPRTSLTDLGFPSEPYSNDLFDFGLRRIRRYRQPGANRILKAYTEYLSRDADETDFARPGLSGE
ncbi:MAG: hypothetical protein H8E40_02375 [Chloroflexi bacterium]|nr:hypothetical protein [Chloroflexota bacterium]